MCDNVAACVVTTSSWSYLWSSGVLSPVYTSLHLISKTDPFYYSLLLFNLCTALGEYSNREASHVHVPNKVSEIYGVQTTLDDSYVTFNSSVWRELLNINMTEMWLTAIQRFLHQGGFAKKHVCPLLSFSVLSLSLQVPGSLVRWLMVTVVLVLHLESLWMDTSWRAASPMLLESSKWESLAKSFSPLNSTEFICTVMYCTSIMQKD